jgi:hypothetical protein
LLLRILGAEVAIVTAEDFLQAWRVERMMGAVEAGLADDDGVRIFKQTRQGLGVMSLLQRVEPSAIAVDAASMVRRGHIRSVVSVHSAAQDSTLREVLGGGIDVSGKD